jgi:hypothetical protein
MPPSVSCWCRGSKDGFLEGTDYTGLEYTQRRAPNSIATLLDLIARKPFAAGSLSCYESVTIQLRHSTNSSLSELAVGFCQHEMQICFNLSESPFQHQILSDSPVEAARRLQELTKQPLVVRKPILRK